ncbi:MAG: protein translocase subunit SecF [Nocardioides sp.]
MGKFSRLGHELSTGHKSYDFIGRRPFWYSLSGGIVLAALLVVIFNGFNFGVEFTGGTEIQVSGLSSTDAGQGTADTLREKVAATGIEAAAQPEVATAGTNGVTITVKELTESEQAKVTDVIESVVTIDNPKDQLTVSSIGASWGQQVARRALIGVGVFLVIVMLFIGMYFREWKMSIAALCALIHDVLITMGIYSLSGFSVTPAAVTGLLAILGFSLYDTVVVFDKVRENTHDLRASKTTYAKAANLAVNQTLVRSINTGIVALIPIGAILAVSMIQLGASTLKDLALAQFVGMAVGVFSSVWVAPRILVHLKSNESEVVLAERRAKAKARANVDPYANVPSFAEDMPLGEGAELGVPTDAEQGPARARGPVVRDSRAAGRPQPSREPRSKRTK